MVRWLKMLPVFQRAHIQSPTPKVGGSQFPSFQFQVHDTSGLHRLMYTWACMHTQTLMNIFHNKYSRDTKNHMPSSPMSPIIIFPVFFHQTVNRKATSKGRKGSGKRAQWVRRRIWISRPSIHIKPGYYGTHLGFLCYGAETRGS